MSVFDRTPIEDVAREFLRRKKKSIQQLADELEITRQTLHSRVKAFLDENPGFEAKVLSETVKEAKSA